VREAGRRWGLARSGGGEGRRTVVSGGQAAVRSDRVARGKERF
jgi:hypothetical protein